MIDINLIPESLRKNVASKAITINIPREVLIAVFSGVIFLLLVVHSFFGAIWLTGQGRLSMYNAQWEKVQGDKSIIDNMNSQAQQYRKNAQMLSDITVKKIVPWSPKFNIISDSLPRGLWIRKMILDKSGLTIEGSVVSKTRDEINNVGLFVANLKKNDTFMQGFTSIEVNSVEGSKNNAIEVTDYSIFAKLVETDSKPDNKK